MSTTMANEDHLNLDEIPFLKLLAVRALEVSEGHAVLELDQQPHHQNSLAMAHGGVVMTMLDVAMARAARSMVRADEASTLITIEMKTSFMLPAHDRLRAVGRVIHRTSSMAFCEADLIDGSGRLVSRASGTFKYVKRKTQS